jgi:glycerol-3-phosphate acyltransferase PlsX
LKIAVDAMGGDYAPEQIVKGALLAVDECDCDVILVGQKDRIYSLVQDSPHLNKRVHIVHAPDNIPMDASPTDAVRKGKNSSIVVAANLVKQKQASALVCAGNTGVAMVAALLNMGRIEGVERPAIGIVIPTLTGTSLLIDAGANAECRHTHLFQFARMGAIYANTILGKNNPKVGLVSNGEEDSKGNELVLHTNEMLRKSDLNFIGNIEGRDLLTGKADVLVTDGFVGNIILKSIEGTVGSFLSLLKSAVSQNVFTKIGGLLLKPGLKGILNKMDHTEYGGAPLLGINGVCIISHGSSNAKAIKNAIKVAKQSVEIQLTEIIAQGMKSERMVGNS